MSEQNGQSPKRTLTANDAIADGLRLGIESALGQTGFNSADSDLADRNHFEVFGWPKGDSDGWDEENWLALYLRNAYARVINDKPAKASWRDNPEIKPRGEEDHPITEQVKKLNRQSRLWSIGERVDRVAGIGQHGLILIDTQDRQDADDWENDLREQNLDGLDAITGMRPILQVQIEDIQWGGASDERWGKPASYTLDLSEDVDDANEDDPLSALNVHWTRVIDVPATRLLDDDTFARPRAEPVLNNLLDIEKTLGAAAEAAYRAADYGLHINTDPTEVDLSDGAGELAEEITRYEQGLQRYLRTQGTEVNRLGGDIQDPSGIIENNIDAIASETGIPKKELRGNESGEVAGAEQDKLSFFGMIQERREQYVTPHIVRSLIDRFILIDVLSRPEMGYEVEWPDLHELSESDRAEIQQQRSSVIANIPGLVGDTALKYLKDGVEAIEVSEEQPELPAMDESNPQVQEQFEATTGTQQSANQDVDRTPPQQAAENARRGLECVEKVDTDAGKAKGRERARQIIEAVENDSNLSPETISDIASFDRHREQGNHTVDEEHEGNPCQDNGFVSWKLWGGSAGVDWAQKVNEKLDANATRFSEGDEVNTPEGVGVVVEVRTEDFEGPTGSEVSASEDSPTYIVGTQDGAATFKASELSQGGIETDIENPEEDLAEMRSNADWSANQETTFGIPDSWEESETPARIILLKAWAGLGGRFTSCVREMRGELAGSPDRFCASMKDRVLQWEGWRKGG